MNRMQKANQNVSLYSIIFGKTNASVTCCPQGRKATVDISRTIIFEIEIVAVDEDPGLNKEIRLKGEECLGEIPRILVTDVIFVHDASVGLRYS